ncbi:MULTISPECIES: adenosylcobinamide-phosphate synthase CbiB [unclassified Aureimonas]|uniref:adenosylcobinamide-phosphate synthase CbiB n=1 Tax=unclassified Aureimonas TaxID=2615206 RepID=UPI0006F1D205|nr:MULTISPECIES: adenosylcobinamide-phosphate synthase CbiB [unclassified Aureimonas]KQT64513.1 hypothetical protein ASG62_03645 [Aureimonas sp. Leaf427]KQT81699.1 hypothetical protein ASG54_00915 [Aureimonas sp. Leaf460]
MLLAATLLDRLVGDPPWLWRRLPHPVVAFGSAIAWADRRFNRPDLSFAARRRNGVLSILALLGAAVLVGLALHQGLAALGPVGWGLEAIVAAVFLAHRSLAEHVEAVAVALRAEGLAGGRRAVSMIVGRDPDQLDAPGVCRAAIESLAENASDGLVAPFLAYLVFGLPGLLAYKLLNTADSMIGHKSERHLAFGWAAARLDDFANLAPARLTALLFALAAGRRFRPAVAVALADASSHRSPNAGWPEAAVAGALGIALGGPRRYGAMKVEARFLNGAGRMEAEPGDIDRALVLFARLGNMLLAGLAIGVLVML